MVSPNASRATGMTEILFGIYGIYRIEISIIRYI